MPGGPAGGVGIRRGGAPARTGAAAIGMGGNMDMVVPEKLDLARCAPGATIGWVDLILSPGLGLSIDVVVVVRLRPVDPALQLAVL